MWKDALVGLAGAFDVLAVDLRGFGHSPPLPENWTVGDFAADVADLLEQLGIERAWICGLSLGGYVAFEIADRFSQRVERLILCNTRPDADDEVAARGRRMMAERVLREGTGFVQQAMIPRLLCEASRNAGLDRAIEPFFRDADANSIARTQLAMACRRDFVENLPTIAVPTEVIAGEQDQITPADSMEQWSSRIPGAHFHRIADAGHLTPIENADAFNRILLSLAREDA